jgi:hypothetical protein
MEIAGSSFLATKLVFLCILNLGFKNSQHLFPIWEKHKATQTLTTLKEKGIFPDLAQIFHASTSFGCEIKLCVLLTWFAAISLPVPCFCLGPTLLKGTSYAFLHFPFGKKLCVL